MTAAGPGPAAHAVHVRGDVRDHANTAAVVLASQSGGSVDRVRPLTAQQHAEAAWLLTQAQTRLCCWDAPEAAARDLRRVSIRP